MKKIDLKAKNKNELLEFLNKSQKELVDLRVAHSQRKLKNPHEIGFKKKEIARISTKITQEQVKK